MDGDSEPTQPPKGWTPEEFALLYAKYDDLLRAIARRRLGEGPPSKNSVTSVVQSVWAYVAEELSRGVLREPEDLVALLTKTACNRASARRYVETQKSRLLGQLEEGVNKADIRFEDEPAPLPEDLAEEVEWLVDALEDVISLPAHRAVTLQAMGLGQDEIAKRLERNPRTVGNNLSHAYLVAKDLLKNR